MNEPTRHSVVSAAFVVVGVLIAAIVLLAFAGPWWWVFGLLEHFRVIYALALVVVVGVMIAGGRRRIAAVFALLLGINSVPLVSAIDLGGGGGGGPEISVLLSNLYYRNANRQPLQNLVAQENPDLVIAIEVTDSWRLDLEPMLADLPHHTALPRVDCSGLGVWSRFKLEEVRSISFGAAMRRSIQTTIVVPGAGPVVVVATHPPPPTGPAGSQARDEHLAALGEYLKSIDGPVLVAGDLNATPWSSALARFAEQTGLRFSGGRLGPGGSWPSPFPLLRLPIDHVLYHPSIELKRYRVASDIGSDHRPILVDLELPPAE